MKDDDTRLNADESEQFVASVLGRTTGGTCARAEELICQFVDGDLPRDEHALVTAHLEHCPACQGLAESLRLMAELLPSLAVLDPGPTFAGDVARATSRATPAGTAARVAGWWRQWLARPRFAFELAYVATLLLLLIVGNPVARLQAASARTASAAAVGLEHAQAAWPAAVAAVAPTVEAVPAVRRIGVTTGEVMARAVGVRVEVSSLAGRLLQTWSSTLDWMAGAASDLLAGIRTTWSRVRTAIGEWTPRAPKSTEPPAPAAR